MEIKKVRKQSDQKIVTIPKHSDIHIGDYVKILKINETETAAQSQNQTAAPGSLSTTHGKK